MASGVLGHGQGGLVALLVAFPRLLECALAIVYAREPEGVRIAEAWRNVRVFILALSAALRSITFRRSWDSKRSWQRACPQPPYF